MPGELPPTSAYTYAVEYTRRRGGRGRGASTCASTSRSSPTSTTSSASPPARPCRCGYYDREQGRWVAADNGVVIKLVGEAGGRAQLDLTGDGVADSVTGARHRRRRAASSSRSSTTRARASGASAITHFTPWDYNWPYGPPDGADGPDGDGPDDGDPDGDDPCNESGSIILCESQVLGERSPISGTPYTLVYQSDRVPGRVSGDSLDVPLTKPTSPAQVKRVDMTVEVAGRSDHAVVRAHAAHDELRLERQGRLRALPPGPPEGRRHDRLRLRRGLPDAGLLPHVVRGRRRRAPDGQQHPHRDRGRPQVVERGRRRPAAARGGDGGLGRRRPPHLRPDRPHALPGRRHQAQRRGPELRHDRDLRDRSGRARRAWS